MDAPNAPNAAAAAASFRRKPLPGPPPGPPPPPDFDPFPQRHQPLRAARSTPNLRRSATPSIYDPPPAYEEFPGIDSHGQLAVAPPAPGPSSFVPGPPPADARRGYLPYRPQPSSSSGYGSAPPVPKPHFAGHSDAPRPEILPYRPQPSPTFVSEKQPSSPAASGYAAYSPGPPPAASHPEKPPYQLQSSSSSSFSPEKQPLPSATSSSHGGYLPGPPTTPRPEESPYHLQTTSTSFGSEKPSSGPEKQYSAAPPSPGPFFPGPPNAHTFPVAAYRPAAPPTPSPSSNVPFFPGPPTTAETFPLAAHRPPLSPGYAPSEAPTTDSQSKEKSFWQTALDETKYFAGGLVSHPFEYTKHHSILRHSSALVWYRGPSTSVTVTIFSDAPLPSTRTIWLQQKGFSGNMGMNLKSLVGANTSWLDVTPSSQAAPTDMAEGDERGCQRDIKKFLKKAPKNLAKHLARETHVVRIPAAADDGYFRLVLCSGGGGGDGSKRKVLCPSPVFRVASTSTDASVVRGASLATMPLEIGIKAGSVVATTVVNRYIGPGAAVVQSRAKNLSKAKFVTKHATHIAYAKSGIDKSGIKTHVTAYEDQYAATRGAGYDAWQSGGGGGSGGGFQEEEAPPEVIGPDDGPAEPFPIKFDGKVARGTGRGGMELGIPTANLTDVPEDVRMRMRGVYFGWARVVPRRGLAEPVSTDWHESIITVGPAPYATPRVAAKNVATVHLIHEFGGALFLDSRLKVLVMGQLRASAPAAAGSDAALAAYGADVLLAVASLSRDGWCPVETRERMRTARSEMSLADRYVETREKVQKQVDRVPLHLAGVRTEGAALRDRAFGNGGIWIPR
ncbi:And nb-arc domain protein [Colletotrichum higginsianum IMI 349063]|uniref:Riboflavin kinase n=1 Tax=Colletotrichum higginsianum (strain IMI 349063) TaxID=759273 RepID=A0A1B7YR29_COLHI|nr:And nb-arc domain protein [Colletotrichum higginsianum IMI 349063]OBR14473.1 And nb-arc domain protein [Colletotrichum higginsianum IMI 349063]